MPNPMHEAVRLGGRIIQLRDIPIDDEVGYGATTRVAANSRLATVSIGYADGYPRCLGNRGEAIVAGQRVPLVGRVSMDTLVVDVSRLSRDAVRVGDWATLIGGDLDIDTVAHLAGTISYELLARIGARVRRVYV
jgi:alanine racemase